MTSVRWLVCCLLLLSAHGLSAQSRPNVIVIMADDIGAEGLACYGSDTYTTPHLDQMAAEGVRFENAYATPLCTPTRVMIMSGLYPNRTGFRALIGKGEGVRMPANIRTFAHDFQDAGYHTAIAGKWQLGKFDEHPQQPLEHGFDEYCLWTWIYQGKKSSRYYGPQIYRDHEVINGDPKDFGPDDYSEFVLDFIDRKKDEPFLLYFPMALVHSPFVHPPQLKELASQRFDQEMDSAEQAFGHMITYMDATIGKIRQRLEKHRIADNTLILFTGDNGTYKGITSKLNGMKIKGGKGSMTEAGTRVPLIACWPGAIHPAVRKEFFCLVDLLPTIESIASIELDRQVDGMDLSHLLHGQAGDNRQEVFISYGQGFFVRDERFRLHQDGRFFDVPVTSDATRYSEKPVKAGKHSDARQRLQSRLDQFMSIKQEYKQSTKPKSKKKKGKGKQSNNAN